MTAPESTPGQAASVAMLDTPWDLPLPARTRDRAGWVSLMRARELRIACGISQATIAKGCGISLSLVGFYETGARAPVGPGGAAYCRVIAGLARHLEVAA